MMKRLHYLLLTTVISIFFFSCEEIIPDILPPSKPEKNIPVTIEPPPNIPIISNKSSQEITIKNTSEKDIIDLTFDIVSDTDTDTAFMLTDNTCTAVLKPSESCEITLSFSSANDGEKYVKIIATATDISFDIELIIILQNSYQIEIKDNKTTVKQLCKKGKPNATFPIITIKNTGDADIDNLNFDDITNGFIIKNSTTCTKTLASKDSCDIVIDYPDTSQDYGKYYGELNIKYGDKVNQIKLTAEIEPDVELIIKSTQPDGVSPGEVYNFLFIINSVDKIPLEVPPSEDSNLTLDNIENFCEEYNEGCRYQLNFYYMTADAEFGVKTLPIELEIDGYKILREISFNIKPKINIEAEYRFTDNKTVMKVTNNSDINLTGLSYKIVESLDILSFDYTDERTTCKDTLPSKDSCSIVIKAAGVSETYDGNKFIILYDIYKYSEDIPAIVVEEEW